MIITKVILQDYGVYKGKNEFDFTCNSDKPIILIGGTNGAGKTTLFESIMLCFYGITIMDKKTTRHSYEKFLGKKIHRYLGSTTTADYASITVEFEYFHGGEQTEYQVNRTWKNDEGRILEELVIKKRQFGNEKFQIINTLEKTHWQKFIEDLIPKGIAKLFFFDGEQIVKMAKEGNEGERVEKSFKLLLGIDVIEQLQKDLQVNLVRNLVSGGNVLQTEYEKYKDDRDQNIKQTKRLEKKLAEKQNELDRMNQESDALESQISKIGGSFVEKRNDSKIQLSTLLLKQENIKKRIQDMCSSVLPFSLIPNELEELMQNIQNDQNIQQNKIENKILSAKYKKISDELKKKTFWTDSKLDEYAINTIQSKVLPQIKNTLKTSQINKKTMFGLSAPQTARIIDIIHKANTTILDHLEADTQKYNETGEKITLIQTMITNAPNDDEIGPLVSQLGSFKSAQGTLVAEMDHIENEIASNISLRRHIDSKTRDVVSQMYKNEKSKIKVDLTQKVQVVLEEFIEKLKIKKIHLLEQYVLDALDVLMHKTDFINKVTINPNTFEITLYRKNNEHHSKDMLSEGEKQLFATAILWGLAKTSGKPLPFMIDTPLARLDEKHRINLIKKFFPTASHQILIFSTDKEIEQDHFKLLKPFIVRSYVMEYISEKGHTKVHDGYFWNARGEKIVAIP